MNEAKDKCKKQVPGARRRGYFHMHQCSRRAVKDGLCKQHHPDAKKEREARAQKKYEEKRENSEWMQLRRAKARIVELELMVALAESRDPGITTDQEDEWRTT